MTFAATASTVEPRAVSNGPAKEQILTWTAVSGDTSGTVTASNLTEASIILIDGLKLTAAPTFSGNVVTLAFADPADDVFGTCIVRGK
jgi:hypothetical protein